MLILQIFILTDKIVVLISFTHHVSQYLKLILFLSARFRYEFIFGKRLPLIHRSNRYGDINDLYITEETAMIPFFIRPNYVIMTMDHALSRSADFKRI